MHTPSPSTPSDLSTLPSEPAVGDTLEPEAASDEASSEAMLADVESGGGEAPEPEVSEGDAAGVETAELAEKPAAPAETPAGPVAGPTTTALGGESGFVVQLDQFSGPLDLLLHLLREEQIEIGDIPIARIADQFLKAIHQLGLNQAADYLDMASRLVRLKAQMLLPRRSEEEGWEDPRAELVRRLLEYQQTKEIALWIARAADRRAEQFARGYLPPPPELPPLPLTLDLVELLSAVERVIAAIPQPVLHRVVARPLDVESANRRIEALLADPDRAEFDWREALGPRPTIVDVLSTLLAILEMAKRGNIRIQQTAPFAPMVIARDAARPAD